MKQPGQKESIPTYPTRHLHGVVNAIGSQTIKAPGPLVSALPLARGHTRRRNGWPVRSPTAPSRPPPSHPGPATSLMPQGAT